MPAQPIDSNYRLLNTELYDPTGLQFVTQQAGTVKTANDGTNYAPALVQQVAPSSVSGTLQSAATATGAGTILALLGNSSAQFTVTGTFVGTITWQGSEDGTNYSSIYATQLGTNVIATTATTTGIFEASCSGLQSIRANITAYSSGSITVTAHAVPGSFSPRVTYAIIQATAGTALAADQTNSELRVSTYVKNVAAGDTALALGQATMAASLPVAIASNQSAVIVGGSAASGASNTGNPAKIGGSFNTTQPTVTNGQVVDAQFTARGAAIVATGVDAFNVVPQAGISGGATYYHLDSAATTNATVVKNAAGMLYNYTISNANAAQRYFKLYDVSSAPTAGSGTIVYTIGVPANGIATGSFPTGMAFTTGISFVTVTTLADGGSTAVAAHDLSIDLAYK